MLKLTDFIFSFIEGILGIRVVLKLLGANTQAPFVHWVYETSQGLLSPFQNIFPLSVLTDGLIIEVSTLFAILIYGLAGYGISELIDFISFSTKRYKS